MTKGLVNVKISSYFCNSSTIVELMKNDCNTNLPFSDNIQPHNLKAATVSPSEIEISWSPPVGIDNVFQYRLYYHNEDKSHTKVHILDPTVSTYTLTELIPDTLYNIELTARISVNNTFAEETSTILQRTQEFSNNTFIFIFVCLR